MKKLALAFISASALVFGVGMVADAQGYVPAALTTQQPTPGGAYTATYSGCIPGETITFSQPQSTPTAPTGVCAVVPSVTGSVIGLLLPQQAINTRATGSFTAAPTAAGTYTVTATGNRGSQTRTATFVIAQATTTTAATTTTTIAGGTATTSPPATTAAPTTAAPVTTPGGGLPATGSSGMGTTTGIAIGLLIVGLGLFVVAQVRRRETSIA